MGSEGKNSKSISLYDANCTIIDPNLPQIAISSYNI